MTAAGPELVEIARPFPTDFVERKDGQDYVAHHVVNQRLLSIVGPFDFELVQVIRGDIPERKADPSARSRRAQAGTPAMVGIVVGAIYRLSCVIDGRRVQVEEVGDVGDVHNWAHDGARLKDAASDALKRCAMRLGLGLHLWAQEHYFLDHQLRAQASATPAPSRPVDTELGDSLAPRSTVEGLLRDHGRTWDDLLVILQADPQFANLTLEDLKGVSTGSGVEVIRQALADHSAAETMGTASA